MRATASSVKSLNGSDTANGETPVPSGSFKSLMLWTLVGGTKSMCFFGSKSSLLNGCSDVPSIISCKAGFSFIIDMTSVALMLRLMVDGDLKLYLGGGTVSVVIIDAIRRRSVDVVCG